MLPVSLRVVLDTNILVRALLNERSPSGRILRACELRLVVPLLSVPVLAEYRSILNDPELAAEFPQLEKRRVGAALERLRYVGDVYHPVRVRFELPRDPKDSKLIELAIAGRASHLISTDRDLLDLGTGRDDVAQRFRRRRPAIKLIKPDEFMKLFGGDFSSGDARGPFPGA